MMRILTYIKYELKVFLGNYSNMFWMIAFTNNGNYYFTFAYVRG